MPYLVLVVKHSKYHGPSRLSAMEISIYALPPSFYLGTASCGSLFCNITSSSPEVASSID